jgi:acetyl-CoA synthetase
MQVGAVLLLDLEHAPSACKQGATFVPGRDVWYGDAIAAQSPTCDPEWVDAKQTLFLLYTSGSTGRPKGVQHSTGGFMVTAAASVKYAHGVAPRDVFWCVADCGWVTGHTCLVYGPLLNGATALVFEGVPSYPDQGRLWHVVARWRVKQLHTAPTAIRSLMQHGDAHILRHDRSSLQVRMVLSHGGEPHVPHAAQLSALPLAWSTLSLLPLRARWWHSCELLGNTIRAYTCSAMY